MKPAWDKLGGEYSSSSSVVIADVDCTVETDVCSKYGVKGYPTIKYYKDGNAEGEDYSGGRDFDSLQKFVKETLEVQCDVADQEGCTEKEKDFIAKIKGRGPEYFQKQKTRLEGMSKKAMKAELKQWVVQRLNIFKQLVDAPPVKEEL